MQQYLLDSLQDLQQHLFRSRQYYQVVDEGDSNVNWRHIDGEIPPLIQQLPLSSAKGFFFAEQEPLYVFDGQFFRETIPEPEPFVLFGVQSCDLMAIRYQDIFFEDDPYYQARRRQALLVGVDCVRPCEQGFCLAVDAGPGVRDNTADLILHPLQDDQWLLVVTSSLGKEVLDGLALTSAPAHEVSLRWDNLSHCEQQFGDSSYIHAGINKLNNDDISDAFWDEVAVQCLACSGCTTLCPTCSCYGTQYLSAEADEITPDDKRSQSREAQASQQVRFWDSCLYESFQREASFHNPTAQAGERVKRFWYHKFSDDFIPEFGRYGCIGCGRCEQVCPGVIGVHSIMKRIVKDA